MDGVRLNLVDCITGMGKRLGLDFVDLDPDPIFKVTEDIRMPIFDQKMLVCTLSGEPMDGFRPNLVEWIV